MSSAVLLSTQQHTQLKFEILEELKRLGIEVKIGRDYDPQCALRSDETIVILLPLAYSLEEICHECVHALQRLKGNGKLVPLGGYSTDKGQAHYWSIYEYCIQQGYFIEMVQYEQDREAEIEAYSLETRSGLVLQLLRNL